MAATEAELAGNYATSGGSGDAAFVAEKLSDMQADAADERADAVSHDTTRRDVEATTAPVDLGTITVDGDEIPIEEPLGDYLGAGHLARLEASQSGNAPDGYQRSFIALLEAFDAVSPTEYDEDFWFGLTNEQIGSAFGQASEQSRGGAEAGK